MNNRVFRVCETKTEPSVYGDAGIDGGLCICVEVDHAPGVVNGKEYLLNLRTLLLKAGAQVLLKDPVEYHFGGSEFFRDNYAMESNGVHVVQAYFARIVNGYAHVFIFIGQDEKSVDEMAKAMETFAALPQARKGITTIIDTHRHESPTETTVLTCSYNGFGGRVLPASQVGQKHWSSTPVVSSAKEHCPEPSTARR